MTSATIKQQIELGAARAFFACAWADAVEAAGASLRGDIMAQLPDETDPAALHAAATLLMQFVAQYAFTEPGLSDTQKVAVLYMKAVNTDPAGADREVSPELFGHYLAMQAMGTGVGLESFGYAFTEVFTVPYLEFGQHSLERDYAPV